MCFFRQFGWRRSDNTSEHQLSCRHVNSETQNKPDQTSVLYFILFQASFLYFYQIVILSCICCGSEDRASCVFCWCSVSFTHTNIKTQNSDQWLHQHHLLHLQHYESQLIMCSDTYHRNVNIWHVQGWTYLWFAELWPADILFPRLSCSVTSFASVFLWDKPKTLKPRSALGSCDKAFPLFQPHVTTTAEDQTESRTLVRPSGFTSWTSVLLNSLSVYFPDTANLHQTTSEVKMNEWNHWYNNNNTLTSLSVWRHNVGHHIGLKTSDCCWF